MTMKIHSCKSVHLIQYFAKTIFLVKMLILLCLTCDCPSCYKYKYLTKKMIYERRKALLWRCVLNRSSHQRCSVKKVFLEISQNSLESTCAKDSFLTKFFFNKVTGLRPATLLKKSLWHRCFPVNFAKFPRTRFLQNTSGRLFLYNC